MSGRVRDAFIARGHEAISCDILPTESPGPHYQGDIFDILDNGWDLMIAFPPCTHLASSGAKHFAKKIADGRQPAAIDFFLKLATANVPKIAVENPVGVMSTYFRKPDQIVYPYMFGDPVKKSTCLWLKDLPKLVETNPVECGPSHQLGGKKKAVMSKWYYDTSCLPHSERARVRSYTFQGLANAMAEQWG